MPKMKSHRGAAKRFSKTANGKIKKGHSHHSHILTKKSTKRKRGLRGTDIATGADVPRLNRLIPYK
ncbi:MAG: 50S ribosomal protein L35 [Myxococcota bacterium]|nr:50S ribosomal protein L35 [Myxococcota bacterium]